MRHYVPGLAGEHPYKCGTLVLSRTRFFSFLKGSEKQPVCYLPSTLAKPDYFLWRWCAPEIELRGAKSYAAPFENTLHTCYLKCLSIEAFHAPITPDRALGMERARRIQLRTQGPLCCRQKSENLQGRLQKQN